MNQFSYACPVCNGLNSLILPCPKCGHSLQDGGRVFDYLANYSPYRPIDDLKMTDGWQDYQNHLCPHQTYCEQCGYQHVTFIQEMRL
ncbi:hypothetical protein [Thermoflavimicrobium dichotomicum]|uniref:Uncharacterized protein n=1 Tax=Thermoflavimicrobium dichotomicum TaxID=46223 RepID=A0A1I3LP43_9BACL|nr:hypothetical protein [Thermoflavimicrobium dichotomicum]SFI86452.1 hypothetical protein SAMN05421852_102270 [Thermoflavimicrobium dichotomicum]